MRELDVVFFGALKEYFPREMRLKVASSLTPESLKEQLVAALGDRRDAALALLKECAVATESEVIPNGKLITDGNRVALLPPVCGG